MSVDLDEERDYSPEALKQREKARRLDDEGAEPISPGEQAALDQMEAGYGESAPEANYGNKKSDSDNANEDGGDGLYKPGDGKEKGKWRSRLLNRKTAIGGGVFGVATGGIIWAATIVSGPAQVIQLAQLLDRVHFGNDRSSSESRIGRMFEYFRTQDDKSKRNVGYTMELISKRYQEGLLKDGVQLDYQRRDGKLSSQLQGFIVDTNTEPGQRAREKLIEAGYPFDEATGKVDLNGVSRRKKLQALNMTVDVRNKGKISSALSKRILRHRAGVDFHPWRNLKVRSGDTLANWRADRRAERSEEFKEGVDPTEGRQLEGQDDVDENGDPIENDGRNNMADEANDFMDEAADIDTKVSRLNLAGKALGAAGAVVGVMCTVRDVGNEIPKYQHANIVLPAIRMAMHVISGGSQIQANMDVSLDEVGVLVDDFYDEESGSSIWGAAAIQATKNEPITGPDAEVKPSKVGDKPALFDVVDNIPLLKQACGVSSFLGKLPIIKQVSGVIDGATEAAINQGLGLAGWSIDELMEKLIAFLSGDMIDTLAQGVPLGNIVGIGSLLAGNESCIAKGCTALSEEEQAALYEYQQQEYMEEQRAKPMFARLFDIYDSNSLIAKTLVQNPNVASIGSSLQAFASLPANLPSLFGNSVLALSPSAAAATTPGYDFGVESYGFDLGELESEEYADPYENADYVEPRLETLNDRYGDCFANTVDPETFALILGESVNYMTKEYREKCSEPSDPAAREAFTRYRFYLLDVITSKSLACYEGLDETACSEIGFGAGNAASAAPGASGLVSADGYAFPLEPQTKAVSGIDQGHHDGTPAFDLFSIKDADVYAIYDGTATRINRNFNDVEGCSSIQFRADDGFYYWYGHLKNVSIQEDQPIKAGAQIAQVADASFGSACVGGGPHLHIDRGCVRNGVPQPGGTDACRDPDFIPFLRSLWDTLPNG